MKITYMEHSGFFVETDDFNIIFDYFKGNIPVTDKNKTVIVFSSHSHHDHFNPKIFDLLKNYSDVHYYFSDDIKKFSMPVDKDIKFLSPCNTFNTPFGFTITTFNSTDIGTAFLLKSDKFTVYHAGDLNDWLWDESDEKHKQYANDAHRKEIRDFYINEISKMKNSDIDVAFIPLDPRLNKYYYLGLKDFIDIIGAKYIFPMHFWGKGEIIDKFKNQFPDLCKKNNIFSLKRSGDCVEVT